MGLAKEVSLVKGVNAAEFEAEVLKSDLPVVVDFWAPWCAPCRKMSERIDALAGIYSCQVKFAKVNTDNEPELAKRYGIQSIPTLILFRYGEEFDRSVGLATLEEIENFIKSGFDQ